jgi:hypothetical protein
MDHKVEEEPRRNGTGMMREVMMEEVIKLRKAVLHMIAQEAARLLCRQLEE